jgi:hypothetical protein
MEVKFTKGFEKSMKRMIWRQRLRYINPVEYKDNIKHFIQRGRRGYSDADIWNANDHIARTVLAFLKHNETCKMAGYPMGLTEKKWDDYKTEMKWLMEIHLERHDLPIEVLKSESHQKRLKRAQRIFGQYWWNLWD